MSAESTIVTVVGSINMDLVVRAARHPLPGETVLGDDLRQFSGGKGANQAVACARMGASVRMIGCVGEDAFGTTLVRALEQDAIDTRFISTISARASGVALITVDEGGQNCIVVSPGANALVDAHYVRSCSAAFLNSRAVVLQLETPLDGVLAAAAMGREHSVPVVLNPAPAQPLPEELLKLVDDVIPNQTELALLSGSTNVEEGIQYLLGLGARRVVVTLGADGAVLADSSARRTFRAHPVTVVDTTAAGDSFVGAYAASLAEGLDPVTACERGMAAGALCVTGAGAQPSLPTRAAVELLLRR